MLQPPVLDRCRSLGAAAVYVEANTTHILNSAYGHPASEVMNPSSVGCFPMSEASGSGGSALNSASGGHGTYSGAHTQVADTPAVDPGWADPLSKCTALTNGAYMSAPLNQSNGVFESGKGMAVGFWYKHPTGATNTAHTALDYRTVAVGGGGGSFTGIVIRFTFVNDNGCRQPSVLVSDGTNEATHTPDHNDMPWEGYGQDNDGHHLLVTTSGVTARLYMDGLLAVEAVIGGLDYDDATSALMTLGANADGSSAIGANGLVYFSHVTAYRTAASSEDVARIVSSFTRPLDIVKDSSVDLKQMNNVTDGPVIRCDHGKYNVMDMKAPSTNPRQFRVSDWKNLEHGLLNDIKYKQSLFLMFRLNYDASGGANGQGDSEVFNFSGAGYNSWDICGGSHSAGSNTSTPEGFYFKRQNRGWSIWTSYTVPLGNILSNRAFTQSTIYPASAEQTYDAVGMQHTVGNLGDSLLMIRQGKSTAYEENVALGSDGKGAVLTNEEHGGLAVAPSNNDSSRYALLAMFRDSLTTDHHQQL